VYPRRRIIARRRRLPRRVRRAAIVVCLLISTIAVRHAAAAALDERRQWGETRDVFVARTPIEMGHVVTSDAVTAVRWPRAVVPPDATTVSPVGRTAVATIERGEAVVTTRLAPDGLRGVAALVPSGWRALAIPVGPDVVALRVGDHVDLIAGFVDTGQSPTLTVARDAVVVDVDEQRVTVVVSDVDAARVAFAIVSGTVVPALRAT
jgi:Flp pilus assembly protein CpaB